MAEIINEEMFRPAKKNGFDREDVLNKVQSIKEAAVIEKNAIQEKLDAALKENAELREKSAALQDEVDKLKKDISEKYQSYIDNYDMIGSLIYDAKVQSRNIISDAEAEKEAILGKAKEESEALLKDAEAQSLIIVAGARKTAEEDNVKAKAEMDARIGAAQDRYYCIKNKTHKLMGSLNDMKQELMSAFDVIQNISESDGALKEALEEARAEAAEAAIKAAAEEEEISGEETEELEFDEPDEGDLDMEDTHEIEFGQLPEELRETADNEN